MSAWSFAGAVFVGSGIGGVCRYGVSLLGLRLLSARLTAPWPALMGTLAVNLVGSLVLGWLVARQLSSGAGVDGSLMRFAAVRLGVMTGFMGGFTTYSTFNTELLTLIQSGRNREAGLYLATTAGLCLIGGWVGMSLGSS